MAAVFFCSCHFNIQILQMWQPSFVWLSWKAGFSVAGSWFLKCGAFLLPRSRKRQAPLRCGGRWPGFCRVYYRVGVVHSLTNNPSVAHTWQLTPAPTNPSMSYLSPTESSSGPKERWINQTIFEESCILMAISPSKSATCASNHQKKLF